MSIGSVIDLRAASRVVALGVAFPWSLLGAVCAWGGDSMPSSEMEVALDSSNRDCRLLRSSMMRLTVSSSSPRSRKLLSEIGSARFDWNGLLVKFERLELLAFFFFIGAGLLEDCRKDEVRSGIESIIGLGLGDACADWVRLGDA